MLSQSDLRDMKKVVDINYLRRPELEGYLTKSTDNRIVLTDFAAMEIYKCNAVKNLIRQLEIVSRYSTRVFVLKGTREIVQLTLGSCKLPEILIDVDQTIGFHDFCRLNRTALKGDTSLREEVISKQIVASQYLEEQKQSHQLLVEGIKGFAKLYNPSHLKELRSGKKLSQGIMENITKHIMLISGLLFKKHPDINAPPDFQYLKDSFVFRFAVSTYYLSLKWIKDGGIDQVAPEKLSNDVVDMNYIAYATYFDGLLSLDKKLNEIYGDTIKYLNYFNSS